MPYIMQTVILLAVGTALVQFLKPCPLRTWLGVTLLAGGLVGIFTAGQQQVLGLDLELLALLAVPLGMVLLATRRRFSAID